MRSTTWRCACVGAWTGAALAGSADARQEWSAPRSARLADFAQDLYFPEGQQVLGIIGDSINATNSTMGMQVGYRDQLEIPFNGWVVHADSGNSDIGYMNAQGTLGTNAIRIPGDMFSNGLSAISPVRTRDAVWSGNVAWGGTLADCFVVNGNLAGMKLGNPFAGSAAVAARLIMFEGATQLAGFEAAGVRGSTNISLAEYDRPDPVAGEIVWLDRDCGTGSSSPGLRLRSDATTSESTTGANTLILLGARLRAGIEDGVQVQFIAHGGWTTVDHASLARFTDAALSQYYAATDPPTHIILWIGQNQTPQESADFYSLSYDLYKDHVEAIIDRHEAAIDSLEAPAPRWLLVSQYKTGYDEFHHQLLAEGLHAISQERENVSFLNLYRIAGGEAFNQSAYLSDGVHPNETGVQHLAALMNAEMKSSVVCLADFDESGFVDTEDYDAFVEAFTLGDPSCDINGTGFVDLEDFDFFVMLFEAGC
ncbi:MAG: hypothetical protein IT435_19610 [Phycisphaerales bacterium]|nr:hypothetical protein [Phycisphaerales bacterium]